MTTPGGYRVEWTTTAARSWRRSVVLSRAEAHALLEQLGASAWLITPLLEKPEL